MNALLDNDILHKGLRYNLISHFLAAGGLMISDVGVLGSARFVLRNVISKLQPESESQVVQRRLEDFLGVAQILEPTKEELDISAEFELLAQVSHQQFDTGESQLCAVLVSRAVPLFITGDKRAIIALETLVDHDPRLTAVMGTVESLEQLVNKALDLVDFCILQDAICSRKAADMVLAICFTCGSTGATKESVRPCLESYIEDLRNHAPRILAP